MKRNVFNNIFETPVEKEIRLEFESWMDVHGLRYRRTCAHDYYMNGVRFAIYQIGLPETGERIVLNAIVEELETLREKNTK